MGVPVYDCDTEAKRLMNESPSLRAALIEAIGKEVYTSEGYINRTYLASYMFGNPEHVNTVNKIVHPAVRADFDEWTLRTKAPIVAVETAILYESGMDADVDDVLLVYAPFDIRLQRAMQRDSADEQKIRQRINSQTPDAKLLNRATYVITNDGNASLIEQTQRLLHSIRDKD